jgi:hypothetical protein
MEKENHRMLEDKEMQVFQFSAKLWLIVKKSRGE